MKKIEKSDLIRMVVLTVLQALLAFGYTTLFAVIILICSKIDENLGWEIEAINVFSVVLLIVLHLLPLLLGLILVKNVKPWLISLPIQYILSVAALFAGREIDIVFGSFTANQFLVALILLALQAVGVGIKLLVMKLRAKRKAAPAA